MQKSLKLFSIIFLFCVTVTKAQDKFNSSFHTNNWFEFVEGNIPVVISVPHGGKLKVDSLPIRSCKGAITTIDLFTIELAREIQQQFITKYKVSPHIVISHLGRRHVDQNRDLDRSATCGNEKLHYAWNSYHNLIDTAIVKAKSKDAKGVLFIDLHGHAHPNERMELGYHLKAEELIAINENGGDKGQSASFNNLFKINKNVSASELLFGDHAFGSLLQKYGVATVPSKQDIAPKAGEAFFSTGPNTRRYTSEKYPHVFGFQLECNKEVRFNKVKRTETAEAIAESIKDYLKYTINYKL